MSTTSISLVNIQSNQISSICKICSDALVLIDQITSEWFRLTNLIGILFCSSNRPTIKQLDDPELFENKSHSRLVIIVSQSIPIARINEICSSKSFESIVVLTSSPSLINDEKNELEENLFHLLQLRYFQYPFVTITDHLFLCPTLIPYRLPSIELLTSISAEKIKTMTSLNDYFSFEDVQTIRIHAELLNTFMTSINAKEDVFILGPLSQIIAREFTQLPHVKQRRRSGEQKVALLIVDRYLDLATVTSHQQDTLFAQMINVLPNVRLKSFDQRQKRTIDVKIQTKNLLKYSKEFPSFLIGDVKRQKENIEIKSIFDNIVYSKSKIATAEIFTHLLESLIYNNLETKIKSVKVSAAAISACLEKFRQSPKTVWKNYELLVMSCALMQLLDSVGENHRIERLIGLEKILVQALGTNAGPSPFSIVLQTLRDDLTKPDDQRQLKLLDYVVLLIHIYSLAGDDVFYGKEEKERTHKIIGKEILNDSIFTEALKNEMKILHESIDIENTLDRIYHQFDCLSSYNKRRYKYLNSLVVHGYDEQPNYRQSLMKQFLDLYKRCVTPATPSRPTSSTSGQNECQQQLMHDIEHVPFDGLTDFFKSAARGFFGDTKINLASQDYSTLIIFLVGGVTSHEIQLVQEYCQQMKKQIIIGSSGIIKPEDVLSFFIERKN